MIESSKSGKSIGCSIAINNRLETIYVKDITKTVNYYNLGFTSVILVMSFITDDALVESLEMNSVKFLTKKYQFTIIITQNQLQFFCLANFLKFCFYIFEYDIVELDIPYFVSISRTEI